MNDNDAPSPELSRGATETSVKRVLVVDDNQDNANALAELLRLDGYEVLAANHGELAMSLISEFEPGSVILDVHMPHMNGHELAQVLRTHFGKGIRLVGMSGYAKDDPAVFAVTQLVDHYLQKPIDLARFKEIFPGV